MHFLMLAALAVDPHWTTKCHRGGKNPCPTGTWTQGLSLAVRALCQLSYRATWSTFDTVIYKQYRVIRRVRLIHYARHEVNPLNSVGYIRQNNWTMNKGQGHWKLHGCFAAAAIIGIYYLTNYQLSCSKGIIKTKLFVLKWCQTSKSVNSNI